MMHRSENDDSHARTAMTVTVTDQLAQRSGLGPAELQDLLRRMIAARLFSSRCFSLQRQGRMGTMAPIDGAEALVVGAAAALDPATDWVLPQYREMHGLLRFGEEVLTTTVQLPARRSRRRPLPGADPRLAAADRARGADPAGGGPGLGHEAAPRGGRRPRLLRRRRHLGGRLLRGLQLRRSARRAGDLPLQQQRVGDLDAGAAADRGAKSFAAKAEAFGFPGETVDGRDVLAVRDAVARARARAIAGGGPTLIEARSYRLGPHTTADDPGRYVPAAELERERQRDPIDLFRRELEEAGLWNESLEEEARRDADARFDRALQAAEAATVRPDAFFDHVYDRPTPRMERQRRELLEDSAWMRAPSTAPTSGASSSVATGGVTSWRS